MLTFSTVKSAGVQMLEHVGITAITNRKSNHGKRYKEG
jgi:hypothetical protein